jgi:hypothetical protein
MSHNYEFKLGQIKAKDANKFLEDVKNSKGNTSYENVSAFSQENTNKFDDNQREVGKLFLQMDKEQYNQLSNLDGKGGLSRKDISLFAKMDGSKDSISLSDSILFNSQDVTENYDLTKSFKKGLGSNLNKLEEKYFDYMAPDGDKNYDKKIDEKVDLSQIRKAKIAPFSLNSDSDFSIDIPKSEKLYSQYSSNGIDVLEIEKIDENCLIQNPKSPTPVLVEVRNLKKTSVQYDNASNINSSKNILVRGNSHSVISESEEDLSARTLQEKKYYADGKLEKVTDTDYESDIVSETRYNSDGSVSSKMDAKLGDIPLNASERTYTITKARVAKDWHVKQYEIVPFLTYGNSGAVEDRNGGFFRLTAEDDKKVNGGPLYVRKNNNDFVELGAAKKQAQLKISGKKEAYKPVTVKINGYDETIMCDPDSVIGKSAQWTKDVIEGKITTVDQNGKEIPLKDAKDIFALKDGINYGEVFLDIKKTKEQGVFLDNLSSIGAFANVGEYVTFDVTSCLDSDNDKIMQVFMHESGHKAYARHYTTQLDISTTDAADYSQKEEADVHLLGSLCRLSAQKEKLELKDLQEAKASSNNLASQPMYSEAQLYSKLQNPEKRNPLLEQPAQ